MRPLERRLDRFFVEGFQTRQLDEVHVVPLEFQRLDGVLGLLGAVQVGEHGDRLAARDGVVARAVLQRGLVQGQEGVHLEGTARLHELHGEQKHARAVVANHALG